MLAEKYNHKDVESGKYNFWKENKLFEPQENSGKESFSIILPPPNITGKLHLGHAWDGTLQDIIIRFKKLSGFNTLWLPGMDHAGISMQRKVEERLRENGVDINSLSEADFFKIAFEWKSEHEEIIREQWSQLGLSLSYSKEKFTMDEDVSEAVKFAFVKMFEEGLIYEGDKVVNWDSIQETAVSNMEVIHKDVVGKFYHFNYGIEGSDRKLEIATTRPETMFGDVCVIVNPEDSRYQSLIGKNAINPANGELLPIIADEYVEIEFGTGVMKCTPAHDFNDFELGVKHKLDMPICMNLNGTMNELANEFNNMDRFECRAALVTKLKAGGSLVEIKEHNHQIGHSERSGAIIEPLLSKQWFVKMDQLSQDALKFQKEDGVNFFPKRFEETFNTWMEKTYDWCISRQIKWGHKIPAWRNVKTGELFVGMGNPKPENEWTQEKDVLDTWFSSALWPFSTLGWPNEDSDMMKEFFPISVLVTGYDIIFFWVARMMFQSRQFTNKKPFEKLLIHGLVRAADGTKMSKSLENGIDPLDVIKKHGTDSLRYFLSTNSSPGQDLRYDETKLESSWNFINKLWNMSRYVEASIDKDTKCILNNDLSTLDAWIISKLDKRLVNIKKAMENFEFAIANKEIYNFVYDEFASIYIELSKVDLAAGKVQTKETLLYVLTATIKMLHPYIPFVTEHIFQNFNDGKSIMNESYPEIHSIKSTTEVDHLNEVILQIRQLRAENSIKTTIEIDIAIEFKGKMNLDITNYIKKLTNANIKQLETSTLDKVPFANGIIYIDLKKYIDFEALKGSLTKELEKLEKEISKLNGMLKNQSFMAKAPEKVVENYKNDLKILTDKRTIVFGELDKIIRTKS